MTGGSSTPLMPWRARWLELRGSLSPRPFTIGRACLRTGGGIRSIGPEDQVEPSLERKNLRRRQPAVFSTLTGTTHGPGAT
jgi:hypothetical protein